ncbi:histidine phosphatase family protein [Levilactobacillus acidifarinae]|uniref:Phosphoglycerate mutase n=1 Tax=Levilactobacillus acidifarinae DSM 19394 = JCM 15949 TaxID=1423715 RepID=A0A0R1LP34_9LACO|nr:histidine phosphatase family protein [Levilactobacillus acidifarinae]KRK93962.1 phosphoglycerate mutase [Levilactobacillus acidifarinae DSM 19394]GEO68850.1 fructose 2,6-bisphosphatase [Levilactobacillus acidifarinae]
MDKGITLYVVRHGQTYFNIYNKLQGWSNSPLTEAGLADARQAGQRLKDVSFAAAYCSDTTRAEQTAQTIIAANASAPKLVTAPFFREEFYGYYEGTDMAQAWYVAGAPHGVPTFKAIEAKYSIGQAKDFLKAADPFHQAEDNAEYWQRVDQGFDLIRHNPVLHDGDNVLLISHGNTLLSLMERYGQGKYDLSVRPANGSLTKLRLTAQDIQVLSYNQKD